MHCSFSLGDINHFLEGAYIFVDFFFILQGYYLIKNVGGGTTENAYDAAIKYFCSRISRFFPTVLLSASLMLLLQIVGTNGIKNIVILGSQFLWQISFVSQLFSWISLGAGGLLWFLSVSVLVGTIVVLLCACFGKKVVIAAMFGCGYLYSRIYAEAGNLDIWWTEVVKAGINDCMVRALAGIMLGIVAKEVFEFLRKYDYRKWVTLIMRLATFGATAFALFSTVYKPHTDLDFYLVLMFAAIIVFANLSFPCVNNRFTDYLDKLCLPMYAFQVVCIMFVSSFAPVTSVNSVIILALDVAISAISLKVLSSINIRKHIILEGER